MLGFLLHGTVILKTDSLRTKTFYCFLVCWQHCPVSGIKLWSFLLGIRISLLFLQPVLFQLCKTCLMQWVSCVSLHCSWFNSPICLADIWNGKWRWHNTCFSVLSSTAVTLWYLELNSTNGVSFYILCNSEFYVQNPFSHEMFLLVSFKFMKLKGQCLY